MMKKLRITAIAALLLFFYKPLFSQDFMMQGWYWDYPKTVNGYNWADTLKNRAASITQGGFTYVWLPPFYRSSSGSSSNGYDPYDLYDAGAYGMGPTGFGSSTDVSNLITTFNSNHINAVEDVVYNHRNGGLAENNPVVQDYVNNAHSSVCATNPLYNDPSYNPYPSDRFRYILPLGGSTGNGAGDYYIKISSISGNSKYYGFPYTFYAQTNTVGYQNQTALTQSRPDGGGDCGQPDITAPLGVNVNSTIASGGCGTDEYHIHLTSSSFNAAGDTLFIYISNQNGQYSDHRLYGLYSSAAGADIVSRVMLQTYTDFTHVPSGQALMNYSNFHPDGTTCSVLGMDWDYPSFYYDYDQSNSTTQTELTNWTQWLWNSVGVRGLRMDDVKAFNPQFVGQLLTSLNSSGINPGLVVGEYFDYTASNVNNWISSVKSNMSAASKSAINVRAFDFPLRGALKNACDQFGYDVRGVYSSGIVHNGGNAFNSVTFINNHDLRDAGQPIQNNPVLAYAYTFTDNSIGLPSMFYSDYFGTSLPNYPTVYLKPVIDSVIRLHKKYIYNSPTVEYLNYEGSSYLNSPTNYISAGSGASKTTTLIYQVSGGPSGKDVIVAINFSGTTLKVDHQIDTHGGSLATGTLFYDQLAHSNFPYAVLSSSNTVYIELPPFSFSVWVNDIVAPLPVKLVSFTATNQHNNALLKWVTQNEVNDKGFVIEKSTDAVQFDSIGFSASQHAQALQYNYQFTDNHFTQDSYYRLRQVDLDGNITYSPVAFLKYNTSDNVSFSIAVDPSGTHIRLNATGNVDPNSPLNIALVNTVGQVMLQSKGSINDINNALNTKTPQLTKGIYFIKLSYNNNLNTIKFLK